MKIRLLTLILGMLINPLLGLSNVERAEYKAYLATQLKDTAWYLDTRATGVDRSFVRDANVRYHRLSDTMTSEGKMRSIYLKLHKVLHDATDCNCNLGRIETEPNIDADIRALATLNDESLRKLKNFGYAPALDVVTNGVAGRVVNGYDRASCYLTSEGLRHKLYALGAGAALVLACDYLAGDHRVVKTIGTVSKTFLDLGSSAGRLVVNQLPHLATFSSKIWAQESFRKTVSMYALGAAVVVFYLNHLDACGTQPQGLPARVVKYITDLGDLSDASWLKRSSVLGLIGLQVLQDNILYNLIKANQNKLGMNITGTGQIYGLKELTPKMVAAFAVMTYAFNTAAWKRFKKVASDNKAPIVDKVSQGFWCLTEGVAVAGFAALMANWILTSPESLIA